MKYARLMKTLTGIQGRLNVTGEELAPPFRSLLPRAGSGRFTLTGLDGGHFESRRDCGWSRRGGLSPDRVLAAQLCQRGISVSVIENAFVLAAARRRVRAADSPPP